MNSDKIHTAYFSLTNQNRIIMVVLKLEYIDIGIELCRDWHAVWVRLIITLAAVAITMTLFVSRCLVDFVFSSHSTRALSGVPCRFVIALVRMNFAEAAIYWIRVWFYMLFIAVWANLFCFFVFVVFIFTEVRSMANGREDIGKPVTPDHSQRIVEPSIK